jgi:hypothetical protein
MSTAIQVAVYRGEHRPPLFLPLGPAEDVVRFLAFCRSQDRAPDVQQFAIDRHTRSLSADLPRLRDELQECLASIYHTSPDDAPPGDIGPVLHRIGRTVHEAASVPGATGLMILKLVRSQRPVLGLPPPRTSWVRKMLAPLLALWNKGEPCPPQV